MTENEKPDKPKMELSGRLITDIGTFLFQNETADPAQLKFGFRQLSDNFKDEMVRQGIYEEYFIDGFHGPSAPVQLNPADFEWENEYEAINILLWLFEHEAAFYRTEDYLYYFEYTIDQGKSWIMAPEHPDPIQAIRDEIPRSRSMNHSNRGDERSCCHSSTSYQRNRDEIDKLYQSKSALEVKLNKEIEKLKTKLSTIQTLSRAYP